MSATNQASHAKGPDNNKRLATLEARHTALSAGLVKLGLVTEDQAATADFNPAVTALSTIEKLKRSVKAHQGAATKAKAALAEERQREPSEKARDIGPIDGDGASAAELLDLIAQAASIEVVASDGSKELTDVPVLTLSGPDAFRIVSGELLLADGVKFQVSGPAPGRPPLSLEGWGLVLDGTLVAYRARGDGPLALGGGVTMNLAGDPVF